MSILAESNKFTNIRLRLQKKMFLTKNILNFFDKYELKVLHQKLINKTSNVKFVRTKW